MVELLIQYCVHAYVQYVCVCVCVCVFVCVCVYGLVVHINVVLHFEFVVPVRLANFTYNVSEGDSTSVIVQTIGTHSFNFTVFLIIKDGECQSVMDCVTVHAMLLSCCVSCCSNELTL